MAKIPPKKAANLAQEMQELQRLLNELLTIYLMDACSFINTNYDLWIRHLRALGYDHPQEAASESFRALRAACGMPVPEEGSEPPISYDLADKAWPQPHHGRPAGKIERFLAWFRKDKLNIMPYGAIPTNGVHRD